MNVRTLIEELQLAIQEGSIDPADEIHISRPTHDHWRTDKVEVLRSVELFARVKYSTYHESLVLINDDEEDDSTVLVLR